MLGFLICRLRIGSRITISENKISAEITVSRFRFHIYPTDKQKPENETDKQKLNQKSEKKSALKPGVRDVLDLLRTLWPPLRKAFARVRRGVRIDPLQLSLTIGGEEDPADAAQLYGEVHGAVWTVMPAAEQLLDIRDPYVHVGIDFDAQTTTADGVLGISIRLGTALRIVFSLGIPTIRWFLNVEKKHTEVKKRPSVSTEGTAQ